MSDIATLQFDPESVQNRIIAYLTAGLEAQYGAASVSLLAFGTNMYLIKAIAEEISEAARYDEYLTRENKWQLAQNTSSIMTMAAFFNYKPHRKIGATGQLQVSAVAGSVGSWPYDIQIPQFSVFTNGLSNFTASDSTVLINGTNHVLVNVTQGTPTVLTYQISGTQIANAVNGYTTLLISDPAFENTLYQVTINGHLCQELSDIRLAATGTEFVFVIQTLSDFSGVLLTFGNGIFGYALKTSDVVVVTYLQTAGAQGDVSSTNSITKLVSNFVDAHGTKVPLVVTNPAVIVGGRDFEDIESIRANAPLSYQTGQRAISKNDYIVLIKATGLVTYVNVWGETEFNVDHGQFPGTYVPSQENLVYISAYNINLTNGLGVIISPATQVLIRNAINAYKGPTDILQFIDAQFVYIDFIIEATITDSRYSESQVTSSILSSLESQYGLSNFTFFQNLYFSQYVQFINSISGVDHHVTHITFTQYFQFSETGWQISLSLGANNIVASSTSAWPSDVTAIGLTDTQIAQLVSTAGVVLWYQYNNNGTWVPFAVDNGAGYLIGINSLHVAQSFVLTGSSTPSPAFGATTGPNFSYSTGLAVGTANAGAIITTGFPVPLDVADHGAGGNATLYQLRATYRNTAESGGDAILKARNQIMAFGSADISIHIQSGG